MTLGEFKAFIEGMDVVDTPTPEEWERIQAKLHKIEPDVPLKYKTTYRNIGTPGILGPSVTTTY
tara:strand:- start:1875 stop:2066 length:192 start_codon:yes stop_codon:yes gene_type:complete